MSHDNREVFVHSWYTSADVLAKVTNKVKRGSAMEVLKIHVFEQGIDGEFRVRVKKSPRGEDRRQTTRVITCTVSRIDVSQTTKTKTMCHSLNPLSGQCRKEDTQLLWLEKRIEMCECL
jgi:hypothetical protein